MTQMFQSLKQYDNVYHRGVHSPTTQDFAVEVVAVILPPTVNMAQRKREIMAECVIYSYAVHKGLSGTTLFA
ncbi:hypothetical protein DPMN_134693 [Dreissena polymorpha]|uniref:Uncharacterized protein n=1 Tax=Dreissena polymorpha TaxID=45954 RepID=A0A9D4G2H3_DREPO|nr:hypothetical protein DPMN_134693 [Dreissena polymorpha]